MQNTSQFSLQDFSLIRSALDQIKIDYSLVEYSNAFYYFCLDLILGLQPDEIEASITDTSFLRARNNPSGHDRGIDAVYIDESESTAKIHLFNFKYTDSFDNTKNNFPSNEIDKIQSYLTALLSQNKEIKSEVNSSLYRHTEEIWSLFNRQNPKFIIHLCSNHYQGLELSEKRRFERGIRQFGNFNIEYHLMPDLIVLITRQSHIEVNAKIKAIDKNFFDKSDGDIKALIVDVDARDLIRIVLDDEEIRNSPAIDDYEIIKSHSILEDAFEDNVRIYLKQRTNVNKNIKQTVLSENNHAFFYFNNGITITCDNFTFPKAQRAVLV